MGAQPSKRAAERAAEEQEQRQRRAAAARAAAVAERAAAARRAAEEREELEIAEAIRMVARAELGAMLAVVLRCNCPEGSASASGGSASDVVAVGDYVDVSIEAEWRVGVVTDLALSKTEPPAPRARIRLDDEAESKKGQWIYFECDPPRLAALGSWSSLKLHRWTEGQMVDALRFTFDDLLHGTWEVAEIAAVTNRRIAVRWQSDGTEEELDMSSVADKARVTKPFTRSVSAMPQQLVATLSEGSGGAACAEPESEDAIAARRFAWALEALGLKLHEVDADGNCLYRAVAHQIFGDAELHTAVRAAVCDYLADYLVVFQAYMGGTVESSHAYIAAMRCDGEWGGSLELRALEGVFDRAVDLFSTADMPSPEASESESGARPPRLKPMDTFTHSDAAVEEEAAAAAAAAAADGWSSVRAPVTPRIVLSYHGRAHYNSLVRSVAPPPIGKGPMAPREPSMAEISATMALLPPTTSAAVESADLPTYLPSVAAAATPAAAQGSGPNGTGVFVVGVAAAATAAPAAATAAPAAPTAGDGPNGTGVFVVDVAHVSVAAAPREDDDELVVDATVVVQST